MLLCLFFLTHEGHFASLDKETNIEIILVFWH
jgi:hypothetical protein